MMPNLTECRLEKLDVSRNNIQDKGLICLSKIIGSAYNLRQSLAAHLRLLNLSDNGITSIGFEYFCKQIIKNFTLEKLWLDKNSLSKGNRFQICRLLLQNTKSLKFLSMRNVGLE
jgi:Ran GTPase-activating protein (RanGAP) involved in mRNA processing and transport